MVGHYWEFIQEVELLKQIISNQQSILILRLIDLQPITCYLQPQKQSDNFSEGDYWIVKLDKNGKSRMGKELRGKGDDHLRTTALTSTGFIIGGESRSEIR